MCVCRSIEAAASHEAKRVEQAAQGELDRQILENEIQAEKERAKVSSDNKSCSIYFHSFIHDFFFLIRM